jgi:hypothetical protein
MTRRYGVRRTHEQALAEEKVAVKLGDCSPAGRGSPGDASRANCAVQWEWALCITLLKTE